MNEFRVFLPVLQESDDEWLSVESKAEYIQEMQHFIDMIASLQDSRRDEYLVGSSFFGAKYRNMGKLEVKVKGGGIAHPFIENWVKEKYGKKGLAHYKPKILAVLRAHGHIDEAKNDRALTTERLILVEKARSKTDLIDGPSLEICAIKVESDNIQLKRARWISFALEMEALDSLEIYIASHAAEPTYWKALNNCVKIFGSNKELAKHHCFIPIIAGYPSFIQVLGGDSLHDDAEFHALVGSPLESLMRFLKI